MNSAETKEEESRWKESTGLYIANVLNHYQVVRDIDDEDGGKEIPFSSTQRHECRAFIRGYIKGFLDALKDEVDRRIAADNE